MAHVGAAPRDRNPRQGPRARLPQQRQIGGVAVGRQRQVQFHIRLEAALAAHAHVRLGRVDPNLGAAGHQTGQPDSRPELFLDLMPKIKDACDAVLNVSTGGASA